MPDQSDPFTSPTHSTDEVPDTRRPDPGSSGAARIAWAIVIVLTGVVVWMQQSSAAAPEAVSAGAKMVRPEPDSPFSTTARLVLRIMTAVRDLDAQTTPPGGVSPNAKAMEMNAEAMVGQLNPSARTPAERLRLAIVASELQGAAAGGAILDKLESDLKPNDAENMPPVYKLDEDVRMQLLDDVGTVRALINGQDVEPGQTQALIERHGWFGKVSTTFGKPTSDPSRAPLLSGGLALLTMLFVIAIGLLGLVVASVVCVIIWFIRSATRPSVPAFVAPAPGGSVYLETVAAFIAAFLTLKVVSTLVFGMLFKRGEEPAWLEPVTLGMQWLVLPAIFYPMLRGVSWSRWKADMGWHTGRGVFREIGAGVYGYLTGLPIVFGAMIISVIVVMVRAGLAGGQEVPPPKNPIFEIVKNADLFTLLMLYTLATVWAPIVEESIFRGAFYRHLRSRWGILAAAGLSALLFGSMHGYEWLMLSPVIALGFVFAMMRNRRDSLIPVVVAHAMHNGVLLACVLTILKLSGE